MTSSMDGRQKKRGSGSAPWMITAVHLPQIFPVHVSVDLGGGDVHVTEHLLHRPEVGAPLQQVGGERMPQRMRRDVPRDAGALHVAAQDLPRAHARERPATRVE